MQKPTRLKTWAFLALALAITAGCVKEKTVEISYNDAISEDRPYLDALESVTRDSKVFENFETRYHVGVTYLSPEFRQAFAKRFQKLFDADQPFLEEASGKAGFFVTLYSPERQGYELTDDQLWSIQLKTKGGSHKPVMVKRLNDKERWRPFFQDVNTWSQEYLLLFDTPSVSTSTKLVEKNALELELANADAKVFFTW